MNIKKYFIDMATNKNDGQAALSITLIIMFAMLYVALFISSFGSKEIVVINNIYASINSFYNADSGAERFLYEVNTGGITDFNAGDTLWSETLPNPEHNSSFSVEATSSSAVKSIGIYSQTNRAIEITYD